MLEKIILNKRNIVIAILFVLLSISIGYASSCSDLSISNIVATVRIKSDIRVTGFLYSSSSGNGKSSYQEYDSDALLTTLTLPEATSTVTYKVKVTNIGNTEMGIYAFNNLPSNLVIEYDDSYKIKDKICDNNGTCKSGISKEFYITIKYSENGYDASNTEYNLNLNVDFRPFYTITYKDITNNDYPKEIIKGDNLNIAFTEPSPKVILMYLDGKKVNTTEYTYLNNTLTYNNVTGNITINSIENVSSLLKNNAVSDNGINFEAAPSSTNGQGVYLLSGTENNEFPIYYYRGTVTDNNVLFANFCWKIVRTTSTGGTKLIYNGIPSADGSCNNTGPSSQLEGISKFSEYSSSPADVGYMYGTRYEYGEKSLAEQTDIYLYGNDFSYENGEYKITNPMTSDNWNSDRKEIATNNHYTCFNSSGKCSTIYYIYYYSNETTAYYLSLTGGESIEDAKTKMFTNTTDSTIKTKIDAWYKEKMTAYTSQLEDTIWCNDRSIYNGALKNKDTDGNGYTYFGAYGRTSVSPISISLTCPNQNDSFTVSADKGNGKLTYPVGLLTADEYTLAGSGWSGNSETAYLNTGQIVHTLSPSDYKDISARQFIAARNLGYGATTEAYGIRPSVSLKAGIKLTGGNGSISTPYRVE